MMFLSSYELFIPLHKLLTKYFIPNRLFNKFNISCLIYEWGCVGRINHFDGIYSGIPALLLPHGSSIAKKQVWAIGKTRNNLRCEFIPQNLFDLHAVQTTKEVEDFLQLGVDKSIITAIGNQRFSFEWIDIQASFLPIYYSPFSVSNNTKCLVFLADNRYGGDRVKLIKLINGIVKLKTVNIVFCVRPDVFKGLGIDMEIFNKNSTIIDFKTPPASLIDWSEVVINFGSSIVIEAILKKKKVINLMFFQENQTSVFSGLGLAEETSSVNEVFRLISEIKSWKVKTDESVLVSFLDTINPSVNDGESQIEFACRKIILFTKYKLDYRKKFKLHNSLAVKTYKLLKLK